MNDLAGLRVLYICYNGITEPLVRSQVLNYQEGLVRQGVKVRLLTFEKETPADVKSIKAGLANTGIDWDWLPYSGQNGAIGSLKDVWSGMKHVLGLRKEIDFVHCRSFMPAMMVYFAKFRSPVRYLYDVRGFFAHEKRYKGRIRNARLFAVVRFLEARLYKSASAIVTLTKAGMTLIEDGYLGKGSSVPRVVIPTCANLQPFMKTRRSLNPDAPRFVYSGSLGAGYMRDEVFAFFVSARRHLPDASLEVLTRSDPEMVREGAAKAGLSTDDYTLRSLTPPEMADALLNCDAAISFIKPDFSKIASCPTKMGEYLAAGLPVVANAGIGDVDDQLLSNQVGFVIKDFSDESYDQSIRALIELMSDPEMIKRGRQTAEEVFSLDLGTERYAEMYRALGSDPKI